MHIVQTTTSDGIVLHGLHSFKGSQVKRLIIHIPGMGSTPLSEQILIPMFAHYASADIDFLTTETRGSGMVSIFETTKGNQIIGSAYELFEDCIHDIQAWIDFAVLQGYEEVLFQSSSLGASKVAFYMHSRKNELVKGLIFISPADVYGSVRDAYGLQYHEVLLPEAKQLKHEGRESTLLSKLLWDDKMISARTYLNLFDIGANTTIFNFQNPELDWKVVRSITTPVLAFTGTKDDGIVPFMRPDDAMHKLKNELSSKRVSTVVLNGADHSFSGFSEEIGNHVISFIKTNLH